MRVFTLLPCAWTFCTAAARASLLHCRSFNLLYLRARRATPVFYVRFPVRARMRAVCTCCAAAFPVPPDGFACFRSPRTGFLSSGLYTACTHVRWFTDVLRACLRRAYRLCLQHAPHVLLPLLLFCCLSRFRAPGHTCMRSGFSLLDSAPPLLPRAVRGTFHNTIARCTLPVFVSTIWFLRRTVYQTPYPFWFHATLRRCGFLILLLRRSPAAVFLPLTYLLLHATTCRLLPPPVSVFCSAPLPFCIFWFFWITGSFLPRCLPDCLPPRSVAALSARLPAHLFYMLLYFKFAMFTVLQRFCSTFARFALILARHLFCYRAPPRLANFAHFLYRCQLLDPL